MPETANLKSPRESSCDFTEGTAPRLCRQIPMKAAEVDVLSESEAIAWGHVAAAPRGWLPLWTVLSSSHISWIVF